MHIKKTQGNQHAVVIGASMAGLVAARVLSDHFEPASVDECRPLSKEEGP